MGKFKTQFGILVKSSIIWHDKIQYVEDYFLERVQDIFYIIDEATIIHEVKGEIEACSQRQSGWLIDDIFAAFLNVTQYQPFRGGSYVPLPTKLQNENAILNIQNNDNLCLRWVIPVPAALFPAPKGKIQ